MGKYWLIEFPSDNPCPVYVAGKDTLTPDQWKAKRFVHLEEADRWMSKNYPTVKWTPVPQTFERSSPFLKLKPSLLSQLLQGAAA